MSTELFLLIIGALIGFVSSFGLELIKYFLDSIKSKKDRVSSADDEKESALKNFFTPIPGIRTIPAWLKLKEIGIRPKIILRRHAWSGSTSPMIDVEEKMPIAPISALLNLVTNQIRGKQSLEKFILSETQIIGRQQNCDIRLFDQYVSRVHAMIRYEMGSFVIYDLGSTSGTFVNKHRVYRGGEELDDGDTIKVGASVLQFERAELATSELPVEPDDLSQAAKELSAVSLASTKQLRKKGNRKILNKKASRRRTK